MHNTSRVPHGRAGFAETSPRLIWYRIRMHTSCALAEVRPHPPWRRARAPAAIRGSRAPVPQRVVRRLMRVRPALQNAIRCRRLTLAEALDRSLGKCARCKAVYLRWAMAIVPAGTGGGLKPRRKKAVLRMGRALVEPRGRSFAAARRRLGSCGAPAPHRHLRRSSPAQRRAKVRDGTRDARPLGADGAP